MSTSSSKSGSSAFFLWRWPQFEFLHILIARKTRIKLTVEVCGISSVSVGVAGWLFQGSQHWKMCEALVGQLSGKQGQLLHL